MPFTFAHPAILIPIGYKRRLSATALIIGSMVPDFEFFLKMRTGENIGHHWYGILLFDVPLSIICCYVFHLILRDMLIDQSPQWLYERFNKMKEFDWHTYAKKNPATVLLSIMLGIISHLFLDAFTHEDGLFVEKIAFLQREVMFQDFKTGMYMLLQIFGSVIGLYLIFIFIKNLPVSKLPSPAKDHYFLRAFGVLATAILLLRVVLLPQFLSFWDIFMAFMGSGIYSLLFISLYTRLGKIINWRVE